MPNTPTPWLWFDGVAEQAAAHYVALFPRSQVTGITRAGPEVPQPQGEGAVLTVAFTLDGQDLVGLNGGPQFPFTEAVSFQVPCVDQAEVDHFWFGLLDGGGVESQCGWLKDRFGVSWQVVPTELAGLLGDPDPDRARRATRAMLGMRRLVVAELRAAADG